MIIDLCSSNCKEYNFLTSNNEYYKVMFVYFLDNVTQRTKMNQRQLSAVQEMSIGTFVLNLKILMLKHYTLCWNADLYDFK